MQTVDLHLIKVRTNRQRKEFDVDAQAELERSIEGPAGLMHPIVVEPDGNGGWWLVAGERRLRAFKNFATLGTEVRCGGLAIKPGFAPITPLDQLDELEREEAELDENIKRVDLSWQERAEATTRVLSLRERQAKAAGAPPPTLATIAAEVQSPLRSGFSGDSTEALDRTRKQIVVARAMKTDDSIEKSKSLDEAYKLVQKKDEKLRNEALAATVGAVFSSRDHKAFHADCGEWAKTAQPGQFDVLIADPPYGIGADDFGDSDGRIEIEHDYKDSKESFDQTLVDFEILSKLCKPAAHAYIWCDIDRFHALKRALTNYGWTVFRTPMVMHKVNSGRVPLPNHGPRRQYELVLFAFRGMKPTTGVYPDVFATNMDEFLGHGAQKPVQGYTELLKRSVRPGDSILDPYAGSGTVFAAATMLKVYATGVERDAAAYGVCLKRLEGLK